MNAWLQTAIAYVEPQTQKKCEEENSVHSKHFMQIVMGEGKMAGESCLFTLYPYSFAEVKAPCKTQRSSTVSHWQPSLLSFYVKLKGFLIAASIFKKRLMANISIQKVAMSSRVAFWSTPGDFIELVS